MRARRSSIGRRAGSIFRAILYNPQVPRRVGRRCTIAQDHGLEKALDYKLIDHAKEAMEQRTPVEFKMPIRNMHRTVGAMLSRRNRAALRIRRASRRHHPLPFHWIGRPELRRISGEGRHADARRRRQRLRRQGSLGRQADRLSAAHFHVPAGREHPGRQRGALRRDQRRSVLQRHGAASASRSAIPARRRWSKSSAITAAST